ncbi:RHS repeat-associated core domain-containing protein [Flindersiella endophytica]
MAQAKVTYEPYGTPNTAKLDPNALDTRLGYVGEYHDPRLGLIHLRARDYNPTLGQFTAKDPLAPSFDDPYISTYAYANNQPTVFVDPSGQIGVCKGPEGCSGLGGPGGGSSGGSVSLGGNTGPSPCVTVLGRFRGGVDTFLGRPGYRVLDLPFKVQESGTGRATSASSTRPLRKDRR